MHKNPGTPLAEVQVSNSLELYCLLHIIVTM